MRGGGNWDCRGLWAVGVLVGVLALVCSHSCCHNHNPPSCTHVCACCAHLVRYKQEGRWREKQQQQQQQKQQQRRGRQLTYAHACLQTHFLAGEERFRLKWDQTDDSVW